MRETRGKEAPKKETAKDKGKGKVDSSFYGFLNKLAQAARLELISPQGRMNLVFDLALAGIIGLYILSGTVTAVARIVAAVAKPELAEQSGDNIVTLLVIFLAASACCLLFMYVTGREKEYFKEYFKDYIREESDDKEQ